MSKLFRLFAVLLFVIIAMAAVATPKEKMVFACGGEWTPLCPVGVTCNKPPANN